MPNTAPKTITIRVGSDYLTLLAERLGKYDISHGALARQMGVDKSYLSRMFNKGMVPRMSNIQRIEEAILELRKPKPRTPRTTSDSSSD